LERTRRRILAVVDQNIVLFSPSLLADAALSGAETVLKYSQSVE